MGNPPLGPDVQASIATLLSLFLAFTRARSTQERAELERQILLAFDRLGATEDRSVLEVRRTFESLRTAAGTEIRARTLAISARKFTNDRIRRFEETPSSPRLSRGAREILRIPLIEAAERTELFNEEQAAESLDRVLDSVRDPPVSNLEGDNGVRTSTAVIRAIHKNFCSIPPFCNGDSNE